MKSLFVDTSAWYELGDRKAPAGETMRKIVESNEGGLVTTTCVLAELAALMVSRLGHAEAGRMGELIRSSREVELIHPDLEEEMAAWRLFLERGDKSYSLTDCLSFTVMRRLGLDAALATDDHFRQEGFRVLP